MANENFTRKKIQLDGPKTGGRTGWYATVVSCEVQMLKGWFLYCFVWHPKDSPDTPGDQPEVNIISCADTLEECVDFLREDEWLTEKSPVIEEFPLPNSL